MISVCMATYNGERFIKQQLCSILNQLNETDEVIVADDASTDNTCSIIQSLHDHRIRLFHTTFHSCKWNFQFALQQAKGDIIFLADQDDVWFENKVKCCIEELEHCDLIVTNSIETDANLNILNPDFFSIYHSGKGVVKNSLNNTYYGSCMAFHRSLLSDALPLPPTDEIGHDIWLGLVAELTRRKVCFFPLPLMFYRRHEGTRTSTNNLLHRSKRSFFVKCWSRCIVFYYVIKFKIHYAKQSR